MFASFLFLGIGGICQSNHNILQTSRVTRHMGGAGCGLLQELKGSLKQASGELFWGKYSQEASDLSGK